MKNTKHVFINYVNKQGNDNQYLISKSQKLSSGAFLAKIKGYLEYSWKQGQFKESLNLQNVLNELGNGCFRTDMQFLSLLYSAATNTFALTCYDKQLSKSLGGIELKTCIELPAHGRSFCTEDPSLLFELINDLGDRLSVNYCVREQKEISGIRNCIETLPQRLVTLNEQTSPMCSCLV